MAYSETPKYEKALQTYGWTDQWMDGPTYGWADPLIEVLRSSEKSWARALSEWLQW